MEVQTGERKHQIVKLEEDFTVLHQKKIAEKTSILYKLVELQRFDSWRIFVLAVILGNYIYCTYTYTFERMRINIPSLYVIVFCDGIFVVDFILAVTLKLWETAQIRMAIQPRSWTSLILDLFIIIPYSLFYLIFTWRTDTVMFFVLRCIAFFRLKHVYGFYQEKLGQAGISQWRYLTTQYLIYLLLVQHTFACIWNVKARPIGSLKVRDGWATVFGTAAYQFTPGDWYRVCLYFAMMQTTNVGFGDILPVTFEGHLIAMAAMWIGFTLTCEVFIGTLSWYIANVFKRRSILRLQVRHINKYLDYIAMNEADRNSINEYYSMLWKKKKGVENAEILTLLPVPLRAELCFDINVQALQRSRIFRDKPESFLRSVACLMEHEFYQPRDLIQHRTVIKNRMVFVIMGVIDVLSEEDDHSPLITFGPGTCFGEASLVLSLPAKCSVRARTYTELQVLTRKNFAQCIETYPFLFGDVNQSILDRITQARRREAKGRGPVNVSVLNLFVSQHEEVTTIKVLKDKLKSRDSRDDLLNLYRLADEANNVLNSSFVMTPKFPWILHPDSSISTFWGVIIIVVALLIAFLYPYYIAFEGKFPPWLDICSIVFEIILILDIYVILTTAIIVRDETITTFMGILRRRIIQVGFYFDVISALSLEMITYVMHEEYRERYFYLLKLNKLFKTYRVNKFFFNLRYEIVKESTDYISLLKYPLYLLIWPFWIGSFLFLSTCFNPVCAKGGWFNMKMQQYKVYKLNTPCTGHPFAMSLYFALSCVSALGYGDILVKNFDDVIYVYFAVISGILVFGYCTADLSATITSNFRAEGDFQMLLFSLVRFMDEKKLTKTTKRRVVNFFVLQWNYDEGASLGTKPLFFNASNKIKTQVVMKELMETITQVPIFVDTNLDFVQLMVSGASTRILPPNEIIAYIGETIQAFYIIQNGYCVTLREEKSHVLSPNCHFGIGSMLTNTPCLSNLISVTHVKLIVIPRDLFWTSLSIFPALAKELKFALDEFLKSEEFRTSQAMIASIQQEDTEDIEIRIENPKQQGSFINVATYCSEHNENYHQPFYNLGYFCWIKYLMPPFCILPDGLFIKIWVAIRVTVAMLIALLTPYQQMHTPYASDFDRILFYADFISYLDLYVMMFVGYYGYNNQLIIHPLKTSVHYFKGKFVLDLLLCFPWEWMIWGLVPEHNEDHSEFAHFLNPHYYHCRVRYIKVLQAYRLPQLFVYLRKNVEMKGDVVEIVKFIPITLVVLNVYASFLVLSACSYLHKNDIKKFRILENGYIKPHGMVAHPPQEYTMFCLDETFLDRSKYRDFSDPFDVYMVTLYFCTSTMIGCGFGDITPQHINQLLATIVFILFCFLFICYVYAMMSSREAEQNSLLSRNQKMLKELHHFMIAEGVDYNLQIQIINSFEYWWKRTRSVRPCKNLVHLHAALHHDTVSDMYGKILRRVPLFEGVDPAFFRLFGPKLKEHYFRRRQFIVKNDDIVEHLYIVYKGKVKISGANGLEGYMGIAGIFGNLSQQPKNKVTVSVTAMTNVDALYVEAQTLLDLLKKHPEVEARIGPTLKLSPDFLMPTSVIDDAESESDNNSPISVDRESTSKASSPKVTTVKSISRTTAGTTSSFHGVGNTLMGFTLCFLPHKWCRTAFIPNSLLYTVMDIVCVILAYLSCVSVTYEFCFQHHSMYLFTCGLAVDIVFIFKIFIDSHKAYENRYGDYVMSNKKIAKRFWRYKWKRSVDVLANFPFAYFALIAIAFGSKIPLVYFNCIRAHTLLRLFYVWDYYSKKSDQLMSNILYVKISFIFLWSSLLIHALACIWYLLACPLFFCKETSWATQFHRGRTSSEMYLLCLYYIVNVFTTTGTGDVLPETIAEIMFVTIAMLITKFIIGVFIGDIMSTYNASLESYEYAIQELKDHFENKNASKYQMEKMWNYVRKLWIRNNGKQIPHLITLLPTNHKYELLAEIYGHHLKNSYIFSGLEKSFVRQLAGYLEVTTFFPGDYVVHHGDSDRSMYFIHRGEIEIVTVHDNLTETVHDYLTSGDTFGLAQGLFHGVPHHFSFRARTVADVLSLCLNKWKHLLDFFPRDNGIIYRRANDVYRRL